MHSLASHTTCGPVGGLCPRLCPRAPDSTLYQPTRANKIKKNPSASSQLTEGNLLALKIMRPPRRMPMLTCRYYCVSDSFEVRSQFQGLPLRCYQRATTLTGIEGESDGKLSWNR